MCHYIRESGAGKTEAAKQIMQYIANVSVDQDNVEISKIKDMVLATNPLLESFGCAKTLRNNNSSRHGKYLEIKFSEGNYQPIAAHITNYLLENKELCLKSLMNVISIFTNSQSIVLHNINKCLVSKDQKLMFILQQLNVSMSMELRCKRFPRHS